MPQGRSRLPHRPLIEAAMLKGLSRKQRKMLVRILLASLLFFPLLIIYEASLWDFFGNPYFELACFLVPYLLIGYDVILKALRNIARGQLLDECFLMLVATVGALVLGFLPGGKAEHAEAVGVMLFYQVGEFFQSVAVGKSRRSIAALMDIRPDSANLLTDSGEILESDPADVPIGSTILVRPGERVPLDGTVTEGTSALDTAALTGESIPRDVAVGDPVISGCVNLSGLLKIRTEKEFGESTVTRILDLVENASDAKAKSERFITRFAHFYTPAVVLSALLLALIPPLFTGFHFVPWIARALTFLVVSCPCALVISVPLSFFGGIGGASKRGILVKGSNYFETLASVDTVVFDKTGTLTHGHFTVTSVCPAEGIDPTSLLCLAAHAELHSTHPIAVSLRTACETALDPALLSDVTELPGRGISASIGDSAVLVGNAALMESHRIPTDPQSAHALGSVVHVARNGAYCGYIVISDTVKETAADAIKSLRRLGIHRTVMLTGDRRATAESIAAALSIDSVSPELLPEDKVNAVNALLKEKAPDKALAFVGDGINDAPVLARADVGIAMGAFGSDAAIEAADIVLMDDDPARIADAIRIARKTLRIVRQNIVLAIAVKVLVMLLAAVGFASLWLAVFADVGIAVIAILNAMRTMAS